MIIKKALIGCNDNPTYLPFWIPISKAWKNIGIEPVLLHTSDKPLMYRKILEEYGTVHHYPRHPKLISPNQAMIIRFLHAMSCGDDVVAIADSDSFPLSKEYFDTVVKDVPDDKLVALGANAYYGLPFDVKHFYPAGYLIATGNTFKKILNPKNLSNYDLIDEWCKFEFRKVDGIASRTGPTPAKPTVFSDEEMLKLIFDDYEGFDDIVVEMDREWNGRYYTNSIDRCDWQIDTQKLLNNEYEDSHMLRPYWENRAALQPLLDHMNVGFTDEDIERIKYLNAMYPTLR